MLKVVRLREVCMNDTTAGKPVLTWFAGSLLLCSCAFTGQVMPITMSDANVVAVLNTIDQIEVDAGELGKAKGASPKVRSFAARLAHEHTASLQGRHRLAEKIDVEPQKPQLAMALEQMHGESTTLLQNQKSGRDFDDAYIKDQIMLHEQMIKLLEDTEATTDRPELRQHLRYSRPDLLSHLSAARAVARQF